MDPTSARYDVSFDRMFGSTDAGGKWIVRGPMGVAPISKHDTRSAAKKWAKKEANSGDVVFVNNKDGSTAQRIEV